MRENTTKPESSTGWTWAIALDGGTTNTRARLLHKGRIVATARREVGVRDTVLRDEAAANVSTIEQDSARPCATAGTLSEAVREVIAEVSRFLEDSDDDSERTARPDLIVAAGMLSSEVGLLAVPHVVAPAGIDELSEAVVVRRLDGLVEEPICFVPGLRTPAGDGPDGWITADVMRGEECETIGAFARLVRQGRITADQNHLAFVWPGSHTKLVEVNGEGTIRRSHSSLAGELLQSVARHTLIAASLPSTLPDQLDLEAAELGARVALEEGLARAAFLVRVAALCESLTPTQRAAFWISAVVADDVAHLVRHPILAQSSVVVVGGREPLRSLYVRRLREFLFDRVTPIEDDLAEAASALGALEIAGKRLFRSNRLDGSVRDESAP